MSKIIRSRDVSVLVPDSEWIPMRVADSPVRRLVNQAGTPAVIVSSYSTAEPNTNLVTLEDVSSNYTGGTGTNNYGAVFGFPVLKSDGTPLKLSEHFCATFFLKVPSGGTPGVADNNKCYIAVGLFDGDITTPMRVMSGMLWDNNTGPRAYNVGRNLSYATSAGKSNGHCSYIHFQTNPETEPKVMQEIHSLYCDSSIERILNKNSNSNTCYFSSDSTPADRNTSSVYAAVFVGRKATGQGQKTFSFEAYYSITGAATIDGQPKGIP